LVVEGPHVRALECRDLIVNGRAKEFTRVECVGLHVVPSKFVPDAGGRVRHELVPCNAGDACSRGRAITIWQ